MSKLLSWVRWVFRALLIFIAETSTLGVAHWLLARYAMRDLVGVGMVALGWIAIGYAMCERDRPRTRGER